MPHIPGGKAPLARLGLQLPEAVLSLGLGVLVAKLIGLWPWGTVLVAAWLVSGLIMLVRPVEDAVMRSSTGLRLPTQGERERLIPPWLALTAAADVKPGQYSVWVQKSLRVNAYASAGHTIAVTEAAVAQLDAVRLEAVLAHELGHHLGGHTWASLLRYWYSLPVNYAFGFATTFGLALPSASRSGNVIMAIVVSAVVVGFLGYLTAGEARSETSWLARVSSTHPPTRERAKRLRGSGV